jgi:hypothetical protein
MTMKSSITRSTLIAVCSLILSTVGRAQTATVPGSESYLSIALTCYTTAPGTYQRNATGAYSLPYTQVFSNEWTVKNAKSNVEVTTTEELSTLKAFKISNKEMLDMLVAEGVIPSITGWSFKLVYPAYSPDNESDAVRPFFYIVKAGAAPIYVGEYFDVTGYSTAKTFKRQTVGQTQYNTLGAQIASSYLEAGAVMPTNAVYVTFAIANDRVRDEARLQMNGLWQSSATLIRFGAVGSTDYRFVEGASKFINISGDLSSYDKETNTLTSSIVMGAWATSAAALNQNISLLYPEAAASVAP